MDFVIGLLKSTDWKDESYDSILVIIDRLKKIVYYEPNKVIINIPSLIEVIINIVIHHYRVSEFIVIDKGLLFTLKFWFLLYYFLGIKKNLFIAFHL